MANIGYSKIKRLLNAVANKVTIVTVGIETVPAMRKTNNPFFGRVIKCSELNGIIGVWGYEDAVNRQREREGLPATFVTEPHRWGEPIPGTCFLRHRTKDQLYLTMKVQRCLSSLLLLDKKVATKDEAREILRFIPLKEEGEKQGVENPVIYRNITLENVKLLKIDGQTFRVTRKLRSGA